LNGLPPDPMRLACPHCRQELDVDEAWAGLEVSCPVCTGVLLVPEVPPALPVRADPPADPPQAGPGQRNRALEKWRRRKRMRRAVLLVVLSGLFAGAAWGFNQWRGDRPPLDALRDLADRAVQWARSYFAPPPPAPPSPTPPPTPEPTPTPTPSPEPAPEETDPIAWLIENPERRPASLTLRETASFPALYEGKVVGKVEVPSGAEVKLVDIGPELVEVRFREGTVGLPHAATNLREAAAAAMAEPPPPPGRAIVEAPTPPPPAVLPKVREDQLGAMLRRDRDGKITGTSFRVWAPNAASVSVIGSFNDWKPGQHALTLEKKTGVWSLVVPTAGPGDEYLFLVNGELKRRDPRGREISAEGRSVIRDPAAFDWQGTTPPATQLDDLVIYQMHPGTFYDPAPGDGDMATLRDAIGKLDHLRDLGVNAVLLMPVTEFGGNHSWGYNPTDPYSIERAYGGAEALKEFIREAHRRGIAVHIDVVHNHYDNVDVHLKQFDGYGGGDNGHGIYFYEDDERGMTPWGPRPDFGRPEVRSYIADNIRMLFDEYRVDGLRWDSVVNILRYNEGVFDNPDGERLVDEISAMIRSDYPGKISIAEDALGDDRFDASWEYGFHHAGPDGELGVVPQLVRAPGKTDVADIAARLPTDLGLGRVIYTENHDETGRLNGKRRLLADADEDDPQSLTARRKHALAAVLTLTAPGVPLIFMGQELREDREFHDSNPLDWDRGAVSDGSTKLFRDLIRLRRNLDGQSAALRGTKIRILAEDRDKQFLAYRRYLPGQPQDDIVVLVNFSPEPIEKMPFVFPRPARWKLLVNTDDPTYGENFTGVAAEWRGAESNVRPVNLAPFSAQIFGIAKERLP
jgi:1,4-alpha-glucan branching enzyme